MKIGIGLGFCAVLVLLLAAGCTQNGNNSQSATTTIGDNTSFAPEPVTQLNAYIAPYCSGKSGVELDNCTYNQAFQSGDVAVCTTLNSSEERNTCIATWCGSAAKNFNTCSKIANYDDRLLCLSRCNPNQNN